MACPHESLSVQRGKLEALGWDSAQIDSLLSVEEEAVPWTSTRHYSGVSTQQPKAARRETAGKPPCAHFAAGTCTRGNRCRFAHVGEGRQHSRRRAGQQFRTRKEEEAALLRGRDALPPNIVLAPLVEAPLCSGHGEPCNRFKVDKWGANRGREYFRCARTGAEYQKCGYFIWANKVGSLKLNDSGSGSGGTKRKAEGEADADAEEPEVEDAEDEEAAAVKKAQKKKKKKKEKKKEKKKKKKKAKAEEDA